MKGRYEIFNGDALEALRTLDDFSVDSIVTDPPAGISFMGKKWDSDKGGRDEWISWLETVMTEAKRVLKPGGHALVWALPRTSHWTATALENAGFEIRDIVNHLFGSGFPKSQNISKQIDKMKGAEREVLGKSKHGACNKPNGNSFDDDNYEWQRFYDVTAPATDEAKQWEGYGTALKPACEHWILCRKPLSEKTIAENVLLWGVGGLNIDASRIPHNEKAKTTNRNSDKFSGKFNNGQNGHYRQETESASPSVLGRFPANVIHDGSDDVEAEFAKYGDKKGWQSQHHNSFNPYGGNALNKSASERNGFYEGFNDSGTASRFFYCAKASKSDRGETNKHPTVKSTPLMQYLCRLITPPDGIVLDMFMGSGSTGKAAMLENFRFIGIERETEYYNIARARIEAASEKEPLFQTA